MHVHAVAQPHGDAGRCDGGVAACRRTRGRAHAWQVLRLGKAIAATLSDYSHLLAFSCREASPCGPSAGSARHSFVSDAAEPCARAQIGERALQTTAPRAHASSRWPMASGDAQELDGHKSKLPFDFPTSVCTRINNLDYLRNEERRHLALALRRVP